MTVLASLGLRAAAIMNAVAVVALILSATSSVSANPVPGLLTRQSITALSTAQIDAFTPYTWYASTGYCTPTATLAWDCGTNCEANPDFQPVASGGNGDSVQYCM